MKEALSIAVSAWAVTLIVLFIAVMGIDQRHPAPDDAFRVYLIFFLFVGSITGSAWLIYRSGAKRRRTT